MHSFGGIYCHELESVFAVLAGWIVLGELLKPKEIMGCVLVFTAVISGTDTRNEEG